MIRRLCAHTCFVNQRQIKPADQGANNGWGVGSRTYDEYQQGPHQRNGQRNTQRQGRWQQRPMGSGSNELPLGRQSRMNVTPPEGSGTSEGPKSAQQSEPQPIATASDPTPAPLAVELYEEEPKRQQYRDVNEAAKADRKAASEAVRPEKRRLARKRKPTKKKAQREAKAADKEPEVPQATIVSIYFVFSQAFHHNLCLLSLQRSGNREIL